MSMAMRLMSNVSLSAEGGDGGVMASMVMRLMITHVVTSCFSFCFPAERGGCGDGGG